MKLFVCLVNYNVPLEQVEKHLSAHRSYLQQGYDDGILLASGPREPRVGGVVIGKFECINCAKAFAKADPFCVNNIASYEIIEFEPVLHSNILDNFLK